MIRRFALPFGLLGLACAAFAADGDPVKAKLLAAREAYDAKAQQFHKQTEEWFDAQETAARGKGDKARVDQLKAEREAFAKDGALPKGAPAALREKPALAKKAMEAAFAEAVREYTKVKKDDEAASVETAWKAFAKESGFTQQTADAPKKDTASDPLAKNDVIDPKEWVLPKKGSVVVTKEGHLQIVKADSSLFTKKADYTAVEVRVVLAASKDAVAFVAVGLDGKRPITSSITDDGKEIKVGHQSRNFDATERGLGKKPIPYDEVFELKLKASGGVGDVFVNGARSSGVLYAKDGQPPPGAVGVVVRKGSVTIKSIEIRELK